MNIFSSEYLLPVNFRRLQLIPTLVAIILFNLYRQIVSYDKAKLKQVDNLYALTWLISQAQLHIQDFKPLNLQMPENPLSMHALLTSSNYWH